MKRIKNRCASYRQHTLPHRRAASRSKPPKTSTRGGLFNTPHTLNLIVIHILSRHRVEPHTQ
nr:hypothetical protein [Methylomarinum sp. Ch1-1]MDP4522804.1 hypothetical protein [Methylomarinum sp. Ch1-1]